jgi:hypothetical protein
MRNILAAIAAVFFLAWIAPAQAQQEVRVCTPVWNASTGAMGCVDVGVTGPGQATNALPVVIAGGTSATDVCAGNPKTSAAIGTSGSTNVQVVAPVAGKKVYICAITLIAGAAAHFNIIEGTGSACTTANELAIYGSTTAANGLSLAANGGWTVGSGNGTVGVTATAANGVCILTDGSVQFGGNMMYVQQ